MLATAVHYTWLARTGRIDMVLAFALTVALGCFYLGQRCRIERGGQGAWRWFFFAYVATALSVLLKGPIGLVLPAAIGGIYLLIEGEFPSPLKGRGWLRLGHEYGLGWGMALVLAIALPWYIWANDRTNGDVFWVFLW